MGEEIKKGKVIGKKIKRTEIETQFGEYGCLRAIGSEKQGK